MKIARMILKIWIFPRELTAQERVQARNKLDSLRESRGPTQSNQARQQALMNVVEFADQRGAVTRPGGGSVEREFCEKVKG